MLFFIVSINIKNNNHNLLLHSHFHSWLSNNSILRHPRETGRYYYFHFTNEENVSWKLNSEFPPYLNRALKKPHSYGKVSVYVLLCISVAMALFAQGRHSLVNETEQIFMGTGFSNSVIQLMEPSQQIV